MSDQVETIPDYSLAGLTDKVAVERKSLPDLLQCLGRELQRATAYECFAVVVEADFETLAKGQYTSRLNPHAACQSIAAFMARMGIAFLFAGSRKAAEYLTWSILSQYLEGARKRWKRIVAAHGDAA